MSITTKLRIENDRLALVPTLRRLEGVHIRVVPQGNTVPGATLFPFFIDYEDQSAVEDALDDDPTVERYEVVDQTDVTGIYYISHTPEAKLISPIVTEANGFMVDTETTERGWLVRLLLPDRHALDTVWTYANSHDIAVDIIEVYGNDDPGGERSYGLTEAQQTALEAAYEAGYFNEPRDVSLNEMAEELGLSSTAMSGRLRRGMRNLLSTTLARNEEDDRARTQ